MKTFASVARMDPRRKALLLAAMLNCNLQTSERLLRSGVETIRTIALRNRARKVLPKLGQLERAVLRACG